MKQCKTCGLEKPLVEFYKDRGTSDGYSYPCKMCDNKRRVTSYSKNILSYRQRHKNWHQKNAQALNIFFWNKRGASHGLHGTRLQQIFLRQKGGCYYCGLELESSILQIEHLTPGSSDGIAISCIDCNRLKWTRNEKEFRIFLKDFISRFKK